MALYGCPFFFFPLQKCVLFCRSAAKDFNRVAMGELVDGFPKAFDKPVVKDSMGTKVL